MPRSYDERQHPSGPKTEPQRVSPLRGPKRTGPIGAVVPGDDIEVARELARLAMIRRPGLRGGGVGTQKIIEVDEVTIGSEANLDFRVSPTVVFTGINEAGTRDVIQAHSLMANPGDIPIDPSLIECFNVLTDQDAFDLTSDNDNHIPLQGFAFTQDWFNAALLAGFRLQLRVVAPVGGGGGLVPLALTGGVIVNGVTTAVVFPPTLAYAAGATYDSGWVSMGTPTGYEGEVGCEPMTVYIEANLDSLLFTRDIGPGIVYARWIYDPDDDGNQQELNDILPNGGDDGEIIVWNDTLQLWEMTLSTIANARHKLRINSGTTRSRQRYNLIPGPGITLSAADDSTNEEVDVTISTTVSVPPGSSAVAVAPPNAPGDILVALENTPTDPTSFKALQDSLGAFAAWDLQDGAAASSANDRITTRDFDSEVGNAFQGDVGPEGTDESMRASGNGFLRSAFGTKTDGMSFDCWINLTGTPSAQNYIFSPGFGKWALKVNGTGVPALIVQGVGDSVFTGATTIEDSLWHHIAVAREAGVWHFYVDGFQTGEIVGLTPTGAPSGSATLGIDNIGADPINGFLAYAAYYETALSASDVLALYESMLGGPSLSWQVLAAGSIGDVLTIGASGIPEWA